MITQIIRKHFFLLTDVRAIGKLIPREFLCNWRSQEGGSVRIPGRFQIPPPRKSSGSYMILLTWQ